MPTPSLTRYDAPEPRAVIVMLHGGQVSSTRPVDGRSTSWRRSRLMQAAIAGRIRRQQASIWLLGYAVTGWNAAPGHRPAPVSDARWALDRVRGEFGDVPVVLLGHSMGARVGLHVADDPAVVGLIGLAPWFPPGERVTPLTGKQLVAAHGRRDRITSYAATEAFVERAARVAASARMQDMGEVGHYLLRRVRAWNDLAATHAVEMPGTGSRR